MSRKIEFTLNLSAERYMDFYRGAATQIVAYAVDGRRIQFPANAVRQFLTHDGIQGRFLIEFDGNNKLIDIHRLA